MPFRLKHKIIHSLIKQKNPIILEVGAHIGRDTKLFADYYTEPQFIVLNQTRVI